MATTLLDRQRQHLAAWLAERALDQAMTEATVHETLRGGVRYDQDGGQRRPGDIVLLRPCGTRWGPLYGLLLDSCPGGWRMIPFGRYAVPAVPGEWSTRIDAPPLRVLCGWNICAVSGASLMPGAARRMTKRLFAETMSFALHVSGGVALSPIRSMRLGPPIVHPLDPRYEYLDEERERLADHLPAMRDEATECRAISSSWLLAAEGRPHYGES